MKNNDQLERQTNNTTALSRAIREIVKRQKLSFVSRIAPAFLLGSMLIAEAPNLNAQEQAATLELEEVVVTGSRKKGRTATELTVPVDVFDSEALSSQGFSDTNDALSSLVPSFGITRNAANDLSALVRPPSMRGLAPDQVLVLVNGKRRHRSAVINNVAGDFNTRSPGSQAVDLAVIPSIAIKHLEVLRDGAAAQYGSDAIAGVMNFSLKDDSEGAEIVGKWGQHFEGENEYQLAANVGLPLTNSGYVNLSIEYTDLERTSRGIQRTDAAALNEAGFNINDPAQEWGNPDSEAIRTFWNAGIELGGGKELYAFGNFADWEVLQPAFFRTPINNVGIGNHGTFNESALETSTLGSGDALLMVYPNGFTPDYGANLQDFSQYVGVRGETQSEISWDASFRFGWNEVDLFMENSYNASNGVNLTNPAFTQTDFDLGSQEQSEFGINLDFSMPVTLSSVDDVNLAWGFEWRKETFTINPGEPASYECGPLIDLSCASTAVAGRHPLAAGEFSQENYALYVDIEADLTDNLLVGAAIRHEDYNTFGSTTDGKLSARYQLSETLALRGALSTGFRAPTPGQNNFTEIASRATPAGFVIAGTFPAEGEIAAIFGGKALNPEESKNITAGLIWEPNHNFSVTMDWYRIELSDRIVLTNDFVPTAEQDAQIQASGFQSVGAVNFYTNAFDTTTTGVDLVAVYEWAHDNGAATDISLSYAYNSTEVDSFNTDSQGRDLVGSIRLTGIEEGYPENKAILSVVHSNGPWNLMVRGTYYDQWVDGEGEGFGLGDTTVGSELLVDAEISYTVDQRYRFALGGVNIFDEYPDELNQWRAFGQPYPLESPIGYNGGYWYGRVTLNF